MVRKSTQPQKTSKDSNRQMLDELAGSLEGSLPLAEEHFTLPDLASQMERALLFLRGKLRWELAADAETPWIVLLAGGTNVGKSALFNAIVQKEQARPNARGAQTKHPLAWLHKDRAGAFTQMLGDAWEILPLTDPTQLNAEEGGEERRIYLAEHNDEAWEGIALLDTPDIDSDLATNRTKALELATVADEIFYITVAEKYNDRRCNEFLRQALNEGRRTRVIFNLATPDNAEAATDLENRVLPDAITKAAPDPLFLEGPLNPTVISVAAQSADNAGREALENELEPVRRGLLNESQSGPEVKRGIIGRLGELVLDVGDTLLELAETDQAWHNKLAVRLERAAERSARLIDDSFRDRRFYELDAIYDRVAARFDVPYLDPALKWSGRTLANAGRMIGILSKDKAPAQIQTTLDWDSTLLEEMEALTQNVLSDLFRKTEGHPMERHAAAKLAKKGAWRNWEPIAPEDGAGHEQMQHFLDETEEELHQRIDERPNLRRAVIGGRAAIIAGGGISGALLTGGLGRLDLLIAPASAYASRKILELIGREWLEQRKHIYFGMKKVAYLEDYCQWHDSLLSALTPPMSPETVTKLEDQLSALEKLLPVKATKG